MFIQHSPFTYNIDGFKFPSYISAKAFNDIMHGQGQAANNNMPPSNFAIEDAVLGEKAWDK